MPGCRSLCRRRWAFGYFQAAGSASPPPPPPLVFAFAPKLGLRIRRRGMCSVGAPLSVVVHARIPASVWRPLVAAVSPPQTLKRGPGFEERAVDTEVIVRQHVPATRLPAA